MQATLTPFAAHALLDERSLSKLRWRCRRGLLENDLFIERFFEQHLATLTQQHALGLNRLMDLADNDLLDLLLSRKEPEGDLLTDEVALVLAMMRKPRH
jgi:antitoxin CptB